MVVNGVPLSLMEKTLRESGNRSHVTPQRLFHRSEQRPTDRGLESPTYHVVPVVLRFREPGFFLLRSRNPTAHAQI
jgi:hypothetical protein